MSQNAALELFEQCEAAKASLGSLASRLKTVSKDERPALEEQLAAVKRDYALLSQLRAINRLIGQAPPLTPEQLARLRALFGV